MQLKNLLVISLEKQQRKNAAKHTSGKWADKHPDTFCFENFFMNTSAR